MRTPVLISCLALAACSKAPVDDSFSELSSVDLKSDSFSTRMKIVGDLGYGAPTTVKYTKTPRYRAFTLTVSSEQNVSAWIRSSQGDAVAWLLDASFKTVAFNDDADASTLDSHLVAHVEAGAYYVVFRDYNLESHYFDVSLDPPW
jgi:hypothetical protein